MKGKFLFVVGLGVGYVLGARAGRERYEQIRRAAQNVWNQPAVQEGVETVREFAMSRVGDLSDTVLDKSKQFVRSVSGTQRTERSGATEAAKAANTAVDEAAKKLDDAAKRASAAAESASKTARAAKPAASATTKKPASKPASGRGTTTSTDS